MRLRSGFYSRFVGYTVALMVVLYSYWLCYCVGYSVALMVVLYSYWLCYCVGYIVVFLVCWFYCCLLSSTIFLLLSCWLYSMFIVLLSVWLYALLIGCLVIWFGVCCCFFWMWCWILGCTDSLVVTVNSWLYSCNCCCLACCTLFWLFCSLAGCNCCPVGCTVVLLVKVDLYHCWLNCLVGCIAVCSCSYCLVS